MFQVYLFMKDVFNTKRVKIHAELQGQNQKKTYHINNFIVGLFFKHKIQNANINSMEQIFTL